MRREILWFKAKTREKLPPPPRLHSCDSSNEPARLHGLLNRLGPDLDLDVILQMFLCRVQLNELKNSKKNLSGRLAKVELMFGECSDLPLAEPCQGDGALGGGGGGGGAGVGGGRHGLPGGVAPGTGAAGGLAPRPAIKIERRRFGLGKYLFFASSATTRALHSCFKCNY